MCVIEKYLDFLEETNILLPLLRRHYSVKTIQNISACSSDDFVGLTPMQKAKAMSVTQIRPNKPYFEDILLQRLEFHSLNTWRQPCLR